MNKLKERDKFILLLATYAIITAVISIILLILGI